jgi:protein-disulfide isomerase
MRFFAALLISAGLGLAACQNGAGSVSSAPPEGGMSLGNPNAKVTVIEYASLGCPICAAWNNDNFDAFKAKYIDTGKVHYTYREFLTGDLPVAAAGFLLAHCAGKDKYFQVIEAVYRQEADLLESGRGAEQRDRLVKVAESAGMTEPQFTACVSDEKAQNALQDRSRTYAEKYHIESTPTFVINGKSYVGYQTPAQMDAAIAQAEAGAK